ncbi:hypothetical protein RIF29_40395 [Crotalaria pallida]|uniref:Uncharacterized protein n=1 Tax=Crotalaria pallida TaxID=3830 RepID=A0AAN9E326_CROPI
MFGDPLVSALTLLAEEATRQRSIPLHIKKITFRVGASKPMKSEAAADEPLKTYDLAKTETTSSNKPFDLCSKKPIKAMDSASEGSSSSNLCLSPKKMSNFNANDALEEEASSEKRPTIFMNSAIAGAEPANFEEDDHVMRMKKGKGLKRTRETLIDDDAIDGEWVPGESSSSKTKKKQKKSVTRPQAVEVEVEAEPSVLPQEFMDRINEMGGTEITLVFSKVLYTTDLTKQANRLLMSFRKIKNAAFLREGELQEIKAKMEVPLIQPSLELTNITLTLWDMAKSNGTTNYYYALITNWKKVVDANELKENDKVEVWSFRVQEELHLALVKV